MLNDVEALPLNQGDVENPHQILPPQHDLQPRPTFTFCTLKNWNVFFLLQSIFVLLFLDLAFVPYHKFACNPYKGLVLGSENNNTLLHDRKCLGHRCRAKQKRCLENCKLYQEWLTKIRNASSPLPSHDEEFDQVKAFPNPFCFVWEENHGTKIEQWNYMTRTFLSKKKRADHLDTQQHLAYFWNYASYVLLFVWFLIYCTHCTQEFMTSVIVLLISIGMYYIGNYLAFNVIDVLKCYHQKVTYNKTTGEKIGLEYVPFCDDKVNVSRINVDGSSTSVVVYLPPMPTSWTYSYYILVFRAVIPLMYLLFWSLHGYFGPQLFRHTTTHVVEFALRRIWEDVLAPPPP